MGNEIYLWIALIFGYALLGILLYETYLDVKDFLKQRRREQ